MRVEGRRKNPKSYIWIILVYFPFIVFSLCGLQKCRGYLTFPIELPLIQQSTSAIIFIKDIINSLVMEHKVTAGITISFILLIGLCTFSGCVQETATPLQSSQRQDSGLNDITGITTVYPVNLERALEFMLVEKDVTGQNFSEYSVHYIQGNQINANGAAFHWMIGLKKGASKVFYHYNSGGSSVVPWSAWLPQDSIDLNKVMMPSCLISTEPNISLLFADQQYIKSIELVKNTYTVNIERDGITSSEVYNALLRGPCPTPTQVNELGIESIPI